MVGEVCLRFSKPEFYKMGLETKINDSLKEAMKAKDDAKLRALRAIKSALLLAKTAEGASDTLSEEDEIKILTKMAKQRRDSLEIYEKENRPELAAKEKEELEVIATYLPEQMGEEDLRKHLADLIAQVGASSMKDMGKVMGMASKALAGKADGKAISNIVKELLS